MSPLWGFKIFVCRACYKHAAPLGLKAPMHQNSRHGIHRRGEVTSADGLGNPTPTDLTSRFPLYPCNPLICRIGDSDKWHMSPLWGFKIFVCRVCYKHAAPLGLKAESNSPVTDMSAIVGAGLPRPTGWGTQLRIQPSRFSLYPCNPLICRIGDSDKETCRSSINMSPLGGCIGSLCSSLYICVNLRSYLQKT